ncbi:SigB/SigF/SigG family RNA polymerase sigma factor [Streptomyces niveus]|uniref:SigB/SigF/SigG family RNA polymerase sigma factor n=1 Tax=Streptomyces niveus TaxID=193462 RepID=UPI00364E0227
MTQHTKLAARNLLLEATPPPLGTRSYGLPWIEDPTDVAPADARELTKLFLVRLRSVEEGTREYQYVRNTLIEINLSLVHHAAGKYRNRGNGELEELVQVGTVGLIKAIDGFDLSRGVPFSAFALPHISGQIMRFFRDSTWAVHVPRRLQEVRVDLLKAREELTSQLAREPTRAELAARLDMDEAAVREGLVAANAYIAGPLGAPADGQRKPEDGGGRTYAESVGRRDPELDLVEDLNSLAPLLKRLDSRARLILEMRFGRDMTQVQIAGELGLSQMHISRLLTRTLATLRAGLLKDR